MTKNNEEALKEMEKYGFNIDEVKSNLNVELLEDKDEK